ncbi:unnamed protein product [Clonostachys rhizophaga]|uniref:Uncharacterized protein n=1 Tax=Clonostachys rhizophaga TaxID=160324 RepID=A0A9N9VC26_9HYPO|nr:unnamed protein product [Clonostachys rhizophaga]
MAISFLNFFIGPLYAVITITAKLLPKGLHVIAIGFALALGGAGGTSAGVWVLQPIVLGLFVFQAIDWLLFLKIQKN